MAWPRKVFIETSALYNIRARMETVDFAKLLELKDGLQFELFVPEVTWLEFMRHRKRDVNSHLRAIRQAQTGLKEYSLEIGHLASVGQTIEGYIERIETHFAEKADELGIKILPLPSINVERLLRMSIDCIPPFEEAESKAKEKGFRDSLIMFTILENIRGRPEDNALLIAADKRLVEGCSLLLEEYATTLDFASDFADAARKIEGKIHDWYRARLRKESEAAKALLQKYWDEIAKGVAEIRELSRLDFGGGPFGRTDLPNIEKVVSLSLVDIESALWKDKDQPTSKVLFKIKCDARVLVTEPAYGSFFDYPKYEVGGGVKYKAFFSAGSTQEDLPVHLYGEIELKRSNSDWELASLRVDKSPSSPEDMVWLFEIEQKQ